MKISILIPVYKSETPEFFHLALESMQKQTFQDFEVVLVVDGPIPPLLEAVVQHFSGVFQGRFTLVRLAKNLGIAGALNAGLAQCSAALVARMDSDDYSLPERLQIQYDYMIAHPEIDVLGANIGEFEHDIHTIKMLRIVPESHEDITRIMWFKCPMNHVTILYKKQAVMDVGGYDGEYGNDDFLWAKMRHAGYRFHNQNQVLVYVRVGDNMSEMVKRRATMELFRWNCKIRTYMFRRHMMTLFQYIGSMAVAIGIYLLPLPMKCYFFKKSRQIVA